MLNHIRNIFYGIFFIVLMISTSVLGKSTESRAAKYNYVVNDGKADKVSAGTNYNLSDGWVGCPDTIYGLPVNSIEADGFSGWGSDYASAYVPVYCNIIGPKAFYSINEYTTHPAKYLGGVTMPARFWRYYEYIGFTPETPLYSNAGDIFCDVNQEDFCI